MGSQTILWVHRFFRGRDATGARASAAQAPLPLAAPGTAGAAASLTKAATARRIFAVGMGVRLAFLTASGAYVFHPNYFGFGWEAWRIASSLAAGHGFSDPFHGTTGPTAWLPPAYPFLLGVIFRLFGTYSRLSGWVVLTFNSACSVLTALVLYRLGSELFGERTGRWAGWTWALLPYAVYWPTRVVWDTSLTAFLLALVLLLTLRLGRSPSPGLFASFALAWALLALANPVALSFALPSWAWVGWEQRRRGVLRPARLLSAGCLALLCVAPWLVRNYRTFGELVFIRSNFGEELRLGNGPGGRGEWMAWLHPTQDPQQFERYRELGEVAYVSDRGREALDFIRQHPELFLVNTARRIYWFWFGTTRGEPHDPFPLLRTFAFADASLLSLAGLGLMIWSRRREGLLFAALFLLFPLVYYVTFVLTRYRHPIEPEMLLLIVYLLSSRGRGLGPEPKGPPAPDGPA
jgi:4-amino-4-deoxy-L-arabinose transferase-like glycosyltransferase